jgi:protein-tyrosine phosphatase
MPDVLDWQRIVDPRAAVRRAADALRAGQVVGFPTETGYHLGASGLAPEAVARLGGVAAVVVGGAAEARDWAPGLGQAGRRLARRFWPGPLTLVCGDGVGCGLAGRLPEAVRRRVGPDGALPLRAPAHEAVRATLRRFAGPLVLAPAPAAGDDPAVGAADAAGLADAAGDRAALVLDDGPTPQRLPPSVVQVDGEAWRVVRPGAVPEDLLRRHSACMIVFVCTGNTCRSPLAEALCKARLAERLGCTAEELPARGYLVLSAGLAAASGAPAADEAVETARAYGADLAAHRSRPLTPDLAAQADYLVAMTRSHVHSLGVHFPRLAARPRLLSPAGDDLDDPIGRPRHVYEECGRRIWGCLDELLAELAPPASNAPEKD